MSGIFDGDSEDLDWSGDLGVSCNLITRDFCNTC